MFKWLKSKWNNRNIVPNYNKEVSDYREKEYPYNIEFGDGRTKKEMDKMQKELMEKD